MGPCYVVQYFASFWFVIVLIGKTELVGLL